MPNRFSPHRSNSPHISGDPKVQCPQIPRPRNSRADVSELSCCGVGARDCSYGASSRSQSTTFPSPTSPHPMWITEHSHAQDTQDFTVDTFCLGFVFLFGLSASCVPPKYHRCALKNTFMMLPPFTTFPTGTYSALKNTFMMSSPFTTFPTETYSALKNTFMMSPPFTTFPTGTYSALKNTFMMLPPFTTFPTGTYSALKNTFMMSSPFTTFPTETYSALKNTFMMSPPFTTFPTETYSALKNTFMMSSPFTAFPTETYSALKNTFMMSPPWNICGRQSTSSTVSSTENYLCPGFLVGVWLYYTFSRMVQISYLGFKLKNY
ncbi:UNVERIFIED_CONTAM: hypothetical protein FKN15_027929 [Acipenser sinensis]